MLISDIVGKRIVILHEDFIKIKIPDLEVNSWSELSTFISNFGFIGHLSRTSGHLIVYEQVDDYYTGGRGVKYRPIAQVDLDQLRINIRDDKLSLLL